MAATQLGNPKLVTPATIMRRKSFVRGFNEVRKGVQIDYDCYEDDLRERWSYERGRLFAIVYPGALKDGAKVLWSAQRAYCEASSKGELL